MTATTIKALYRQAFRVFGTLAPWNMRAIEDPTPADALAITAALRTHGRMAPARGPKEPPLKELAKSHSTGVATISRLAA